jgi:hypothetical protein
MPLLYKTHLSPAAFKTAQLGAPSLHTNVFCNRNVKKRKPLGIQLSVHEGYIPWDTFHIQDVPWTRRPARPEREDKTSLIVLPSDIFLWLALVC